MHTPRIKLRKALKKKAKELKAYALCCWHRLFEFKRTATIRTRSFLLLLFEAFFRGAACDWGVHGTAIGPTTSLIGQVDAFLIFTYRCMHASHFQFSIYFYLPHEDKIPFGSFTSR